MKQLLQRTWLLLVLALASSVSAQTVSIDGISYKLNATAKTAEITYNKTNYSMPAPTYSGTIVIPEKITYSKEEYEVTGIGADAFYNCSGLTAISIPNRVKTIGSQAFFLCSGLTSVNIPDSVTIIEDRAFCGCKGLSTLNLTGDGLTLGASSFYGCSSLKTVSFSGSLTSIGRGAFGNCTALTAVHVPDVAAWMQIDFGNVDANPLHYAHRLYCDGEEVQELRIPEGVTSIKPLVFVNCSGLTSLHIPNSVASIGHSAFYGCTGLTSINISGTVTSIGLGAFSSTGIKTVHITDLAAWMNIDFTDSSSSPLCNGARLLVNGEELRTLNIPDTVTSIKPFAFWGCTQLTAVSIPSSVTSIGLQAFYGCTNLTDVHITDLAAWLNIDFDYSGNPLCYGARLHVNGQELQTLTIPNSTTTIKPFVLQGCSSLTSVSIPSSVTSTGLQAFYGCTNLTDVHITDLAAWLNIDFDYYFGNPLCYGARLYVNGAEITDLVIPDTVTSIKPRAFWGCSSLTSVSIPSSVTSIGRDAFYSCTNLTDVHITDLAAWLNIDFDYCGNPLYNGARLHVNGQELQTLTIPNSTTTIKPYVLQGCSSLTSVSIPSSVTSIGENAFYGCTNLTDVHITDLAAWLNIDFDYFGNPLCNGARLYVNGAEITDLVIPDTVTTIPARAYDGLTIQSVTLPRSVTKIGEDAFRGCDNLHTVYVADREAWSNITFENANANPLCNGARLYADGEEVAEWSIPEGTTAVKAYAYYGCTSLTTVTVPASVTKFESQAFGRCPNLNTVHSTDLIAWSESTFADKEANPLNNGARLYENGTEVTELAISQRAYCKEYAFCGCLSLTSITLPSNTESIPNGCFDGCTSLASISLPYSVTRIGDYAFRGCSSLPSINIPYAVKTIGYSAFEKCTGLTSIGISSGVTQIENRAFFGCTGLTSVRIPQNVSYVGECAFDSCTALREVYYMNPNSDAKMYYYTGQGGRLYAYGPVIDRCREYWQNVEVLQQINYYYVVKDLEKRFHKVSFALEPVSDNMELILEELRYNGEVLHPNANGKYELIPVYKEDIPLEFVLRHEYGQYTETLEGYLNLTTPFLHGIPLHSGQMSQQVKVVAEFDDSGTPVEVGVIADGRRFPASRTLAEFDDLVGGEVWINGLKSHTKYTYKPYVLYTDGTLLCGKDSIFFTTAEIPMAVEARDVRPTTATLVGSSLLDEGLTAVGTFLGYEYGRDSLTVDGLVPGASNKVTYQVLVAGYDTISLSYTFDTPELQFNTLPAKATSNTRAVICAETNMGNEETGAGFEWRRIDAPDLVPSSFVNCAVHEGVMEGALNGLSANTYYKYRPYYETKSGVRHYGEWIGLGTADAYVYFTPTVHTYATASVGDGTIRLQGYALQGSDDIVEQGFEYWLTAVGPRAANAAPAQADVQRVTATGQRMTVDLSDLVYNATYTYRAYVKTAKETTYGEEQTFTTPFPTGVEEVPAAVSEETFAVEVLHSASAGSLQVRVSGETGTGRYGLFTLRGTQVATGEVQMDGTWQTIRVGRLAPGLYLLRVQGERRGHTHKLMVR